LTLPAYNIGAFAPSAADVEQEVRRAFPTADISYKIDTKRQGIVDSWPADVNDDAARKDWGFTPKFGFEEAFREYLIPTIKSRYA
jgi:nucleoside-diphosphate-sugar epimerase